MSDAMRPMPQITPVSAAFWEGCREGVLRVQECMECGHLQFYPRSLCTACASTNLGWRTVSGAGTLYAATVIRRAPSQFFAGRAPYVLAIVELDEGPRMMANIVDCDVDSVRVGIRVRVTFEQVSEEISLPQFRLT